MTALPAPGTSSKREDVLNIRMNWGTGDGTAGGRGLRCIVLCPEVEVTNPGSPERDGREGRFVPSSGQTGGKPDGSKSGSKSVTQPSKVAALNCKCCERASQCEAGGKE